MNPLVLVLGPTGSGKSDLALDIAERLGGEIVNCDSMQMYRGFDIGTAKTPVDQRRGIPHHLFDVVDPREVFTAGEYVRIARPVLRDIADRGRLAVVVGGTGFYVRALLEGLFQGPARDIELRNRLLDRETRRPGLIHRALSRFDPPAALRIHANDKNKLVRALEVYLSARQPMTRLFQTGREALAGFAILKLILNPPREELQYKLNQRCVRLLEGGLIQEIHNILTSGISPGAKPFEAIGYKEGLRFVQGELSHEEALELMRRDTRRYAKRQLTWFRREADAHWLPGFGTDSAIVCSAFEVLAKFLQTLE